jgi:hypothetical protein
MDTAQVLSYLHAQRDRIVKAIAALEELGWSAAAKLTTSTPTKTAELAPGTKPTAKKRVLSAAVRNKMSEAAKERWAKRKRAAKRVIKKAAVVPVAVAAMKEAPKKTATKKAKGGITAAGRKKISEAAKARWAAKKAATKAATA